MHSLPNGRDPVDVGARARPRFKAGEVRLDVHRQGGTQITETRMHLAADRAAMRALRLFGREQAGVRPDFMEVFGNGQRVPDLQPRYGSGRGRGKTAIATAIRRASEGSSVETLLLVEVQAGHFAQQPAAQRPGAVVFAGDAESSNCHAVPPRQIAPAIRALREARHLNWGQSAKSKRPQSPTVQDVHIPVAVQQKIH